MHQDKSPHEEAAAEQPHGEHGHFAPKQPGDTPHETHPVTAGGTNDTGGAASAKADVSALLTNQVHVDHNTKNDALLDVHLGNPLRRITNIIVQ